MKSKVLVLLAAGLLVSATSAQANLLTNGSFESGAFVNQGNNTMSLGTGSTVISAWTETLGGHWTLESATVGATLTAVIPSA